MKKWLKRFGILLLLLTLSSLFIVTSNVLPVNAEEDNETKIEKQLKEEPIEFGNEEFKIKIINVWLEEHPNNDGKSIVFEYDFTNLKDKPTGPDTDFDFYTDVIQDNDENIVNLLDWSPNHKYNLEDWAQVKKDGTVPWAEAYELDDEEIPVILKAFDFITGEEWGEWEFKIEDLELMEPEDLISEDSANNNQSPRKTVSKEDVIKVDGEEYIINPVDGIMIPVYRNPDGSYYFSPEHDPALLEERWRAMEEAYYNEVDMSDVYGDDWKTNPDLNNGYHNNQPVEPYTGWDPITEEMIIEGQPAENQYQRYYEHDGYLYENPIYENDTYE